MRKALMLAPLVAVAMDAEFGTLLFGVFVGAGLAVWVLLLADDTERGLRRDEDERRRSLGGDSDGNP